MRPRAAFFPSFYKDNKLSHYYKVADEEMSKVLADTMIKILQHERLIYPILRNMTDQQNANFIDSLIKPNDALYPHSIFIEVYAEPGGQELVKSFLALLQELPAELDCLKPKFSKLLESRLSDFLNPEVTTETIANKKIHAIMSNNANFKTMSARHQELFIDVLRRFRHLIIKNRELIIFKKPGDNGRITKENISAKLGMTVEQALGITKLLDQALQAELSVIMMNYLAALVTSHQQLPPPVQNAEAFALILLEVKSRKSPLAFYNMQLGFPLTRHLLVDRVGAAFQVKLDGGMNIYPSERPKYFICMLAKFYPEFSDVQLTKSLTVAAANKLTSQISNNNLLIQEKLIQFQVLFALTQYHANAHSNPLDPILGIDNTRTWKGLMTTIRHAAFAQLKNINNYPHPRQSSQYLTMLHSVLALPLFKQHSGNYSGLFMDRTATVTQIEELIKQLDRPREMVSYR